MKNKKYYLVGLVIIAVLFSAKTVFAQTLLPRITTVCESKLGTLTAVNDGFSIFENCPLSSQRKVILGEAPTGGNVTPIEGNIVMSHATLTLTTDGKAWEYDTTQAKWINNSRFDLPLGVNPMDVVIWVDQQFVLKSGDVYKWNFDQNSWINIGHP